MTSAGRSISSVAGAPERDPRDLAGPVVAAFGDAGLTLATAESLTGGALAAAVVAVPGASAVYRGGIVAYATDVKAAVLGVDGALLAERGAVDPDVAVQMAKGVRRLLAADIGAATTGVAGPTEQDGRPVGLVYVAVSDPAGTDIREFRFDGDRDAIREHTVRVTLALLSSRSVDLR